MKNFLRFLSFALLACAVLNAAEIRIATSGAFTPAYRELVPVFEQQTKHKVVSSFGPSMGDAPDSIPSRLERNEPLDVVILAAPALDDLIRQGKVLKEGRVDLVRSLIGMAVKAGAPKPDISTLDGFKKALLNAKAIAYSDSASGIYLVNELFPKLGIAAQVLPKSTKTRGMVAESLVRGDADLAFQQVAELRSVKGAELVGPLPEGAQRVTLFSAGIVAKTADKKLAAEAIRFFASSTAAPVIRKTGLDPIAAGSK